MKRRFECGRISRGGTSPLTLIPSPLGGAREDRVMRLSKVGVPCQFAFDQSDYLQIKRGDARAKHAKKNMAIPLTPSFFEAVNRTCFCKKEMLISP